ncbi:MAG: two pore domain potassium channel family protein [Planctomycetaceae bacterium]|nr:two pore domain potassium channel family protein [Planctomycetaceae bacterium]
MRFYSRWKFTILLAVALLVIGARLAISGSAAEEVLLDVFGVVFLATGLLSWCDDKRYRAAALILGCPAICLSLISHAFPREVSATMLLLGRLSGTIFLGFILVALLRSVVTERAVTRETISAALLGYVIIGFVWTHIYFALELSSPGSFAVTSSSPDQLHEAVHRQAILEYFSFATLSTLGYGDVTPVSRPARSFACLEAICGQFYLAVLVAGLVGMRGTRPEPPS